MKFTKVISRQFCIILIIIFGFNISLGFIFVEIFGLGGKKEWNDSKKSEDLEPYDERAEAAFYALNEVSTITKTYEEIQDIIERNNLIVTEGDIVEGFDEIPYSVKEYYKAELRANEIRWELINNVTLSVNDMNTLDLELEELISRIDMLKEDIGDAYYRNIEGMTIENIQNRYGEIDNLKRDLTYQIEVLSDDRGKRYDVYDRVDFERSKKRQDMFDRYMIQDVRNLMTYDNTLDIIYEEKENIRIKIRDLNDEIEELQNEKEDLGAILELNGVVIEEFEQNEGIDPLVLDYYDKELQITEATDNININVDELNALKDEVRNIKNNVIRSFYYINIERMTIGEVEERYLEVVQLIRALRLEIEVQELDIEERNAYIDRLKSNKVNKKKVNKHQNRRNTIVDDNNRDIGRVEDLLLEEEHLLAILELRNVETVVPDPIDEPVIIPEYIVNYYTTQLQIEEIQAELNGDNVDDERKNALESDLSVLIGELDGFKAQIGENEYYIDISGMTVDTMKIRYDEINDLIFEMEATIMLNEDEIDRRNIGIDDLKDKRDKLRKKHGDRSKNRNNANLMSKKNDYSKEIKKYDDRIDKGQVKRKRVRNATNNTIKDVEELELERGHLIIILDIKGVFEDEVIKGDVGVGSGEDNDDIINNDDIIIKPPPDNLTSYYATELEITRTQLKMDELIKYINEASKWENLVDEEEELVNLENNLGILMVDVDMYKQSLGDEYYINIQGMTISDIINRDHQITEEINVLKEEIIVQEEVIDDLTENINRLKNNEAKKKKVNKEERRRHNEITGNNKDIEKLQDLLLEQDHLKIIMDKENIVTPDDETWVKGELAMNYNIIEQELGWMLYNTSRVLEMKFDNRLNELNDLLDEFDTLNISEFKKMIEKKFM